MRTRPSDSTTSPEQKMSLLSLGLATGTGVKELFDGSQTVAEEDPMQSGPPSYISTFPFFSRIMLTATSGQFMTDDHCPTTLGSLAGLAVVNDQLLGLAMVSPARS